MGRAGVKWTVGKFDPEFRFLLDLDATYEEWRALAAEWFSTQKHFSRKQTAMTRFFVRYLHGLQLDKRPVALLHTHSALPSLWDALDLDALNKKEAKQSYNTVSDFVDWVLKEKLAENDAEGHRVVPVHLRNPFPRMSVKVIGKVSDLEFRYLLEHDTRMEDWRALASEWIAAQRAGTDAKRIALDKFLLTYIIQGGQERNPYAFVRRETRKLPFFDALMAARKGVGARLGDLKPTKDNVKCNNYVHDFLAWLLSDKLSVEDDGGHRVVPVEFDNPVPRVGQSGATPPETLKTPLAYRYIKVLRSMLAHGTAFHDWKWAQYAMDSDKGGDWFVANPALVNPDDPDCVWRERVTTKYERKTHGLPEKVIELWSPVRSVTLYLKLELPLRTFQVRMLDSGEADTWRYESGKFVLNDSPLAIGSEKRPSQRGVFHRSSNEAGAGFYINTNKTADINKEERDKGYTIPWTYEPALRWLEKLRNWQERYNPIDAPTPWLDLEAKHFSRTPQHPAVLEERGSACFLFRDAAAKGSDREKPIPHDSVELLWYLLLSELERRCARNGETLDDGSPLRFANPDSATGTYFPLHALRVSLITAYALEGGVPFPVISKLIAGHARIIMTLYYTKAGKAFVTDIMQEAERRMLAVEAASHKRFLMDRTYQEIAQRFTYMSPDAIKACQQQKSAAGFVIEDKGICPVGGGLCDVGGDPLTDRKTQPLYGPVSGYPGERNCVRCRFFLTGPAFLPGLVARFNQITYEATECAERYVRLEQEVHALEEARSACEERDQAFTQSNELERASQRYEAEAEKANKLFSDLHACIRLIKRSVEIANSQVNESQGMSLVANGGITDIQFALIETESELHQLEVMCENAVIYPEVDASKAALRRSQILDAMLQMNGKAPIFFRLSPDQQLRVGNEVMKLIQARTGSLKGAVEFAEGRRMLEEIGLLDETANLVEERSAGVGFRQVIEAARHLKLLSDDNNVLEDDDAS